MSYVHGRVIEKPPSAQKSPDFTNRLILPIASKLLLSLRRPEIDASGCLNRTIQHPARGTSIV